MTCPLSTARGQLAAIVVLGVALPHRASAQSEPPSGEMSFALTGDAIISQRLSPFDEPEYLSMIQVIRGTDMAFTNLEVLFHTFEEGYPAAHSGGTWMAAEPLLADELVWAGFDMVSTANNHTMDYSAGGLRATLRTLDLAGLVHAGAGENLARARAPGYLETAGGRVALISVASTFSDEDRAGPQRGDLRGRPGLSPLRYTAAYVVSDSSLERLRQVRAELGYGSAAGATALRFFGTEFVAGDTPGRKYELNEDDLTQVLSAVTEATRQADWVVVASHSHESGESREVPADFLITFAHAVIDAGADIFVGHGPHVLRGVEIYNGRPIFYSLSNFIFQNETVRFLPGDFYDQLDLPQDASAADGFDRRNETSRGGFPGQRTYWESVIAVPMFSNGDLAEIRLFPIDLGYGRPRPQRGRPRLADPETGRRIIEHLTGLSREFGTEIRYDPTANIGLMVWR